MEANRVMGLKEKEARGRAEEANGKYEQMKAKYEDMKHKYEQAKPANASVILLFISDWALDDDGVFLHSDRTPPHATCYVAVCPRRSVGKSQSLQTEDARR